ncbi:prolyl-tRNA synthetase associated domain-containing protein [Azospirillum canadense]|uniref:prolyl-tRNA synthetase associated domain-containing protein n=1 Tax=Azospirillum canadense TaxID=403962 RepID=UPI002226443A|nr:prolyl-tRNA synthetase associated domain-containing protein [Azospirillum canadense]MCW2242002.1 Ala-tRNA(Pro) deacylase [Azospirillum canadense]
MVESSDSITLHWREAGIPEELCQELALASTPMRLHAHPPVRTVADAEEHWRSVPGLHTKNLFLKDAKGVLWLVVLPHDQSVNLKALAPVIGAAKLSFASPITLEQVLAIEPGGVSPLALVADKERRVRPVLERRVLAGDVVNFHPMTNRATLSMHPDDLSAFLRRLGYEPTIVDLA